MTIIHSDTILSYILLFLYKIKKVLLIMSFFKKGKQSIVQLGITLLTVF